jgi:hypothetical protein
VTWVRLGDGPEHDGWSARELDALFARRHEAWTDAMQALAVACDGVVVGDGDELAILEVLQVLREVHRLGEAPYPWVVRMSADQRRAMPMLARHLDAVGTAEPDEAAASED